MVMSYSLWCARAVLVCVASELETLHVSYCIYSNDILKVRSQPACFGAAA